MTNTKPHHHIWPPLWQRAVAAIMSILSIGMVLAALTLLFVTQPALTFICLLVAVVLFWGIGRLSPQMAS